MASVTADMLVAGHPTAVMLISVVIAAMHATGSATFRIRLSSYTGLETVTDPSSSSNDVPVPVAFVPGVRQGLILATSVPPNEWLKSALHRRRKFFARLQNDQAKPRIVGQCIIEDLHDCVVVRYSLRERLLDLAGPGPPPKCVDGRRSSNRSARAVCSPRQLEREGAAWNMRNRQQRHCIM